MPEVAEPPPTETVTVVLEGSVPPAERAAVTVTVVAEALSPTLDGFTDRFTVEAPSSAPDPPSSSTVACSGSSLRIVPVALLAVIKSCGLGQHSCRTVRPTVTVSSGSWTSSSFVATVKVCVSPAVPSKRTIDRGRV